MKVNVDNYQGCAWNTCRLASVILKGKISYDTVI